MPPATHPATDRTTPAPDEEFPRQSPRGRRGPTLPRSHLSTTTPSGATSHSSVGHNRTFWRSWTLLRRRSQSPPFLPPPPGPDPTPVLDPSSHPPPRTLDGVVDEVNELGWTLEQGEGPEDTGRGRVDWGPFLPPVSSVQKRGRLPVPLHRPRISLPRVSTPS